MARSLVLNATFEPLCVVPSRRALILVLAEKAETVHGTGCLFHSERLSVEEPSVVRLQRFVVQEIGEVFGASVDKYAGTAIVLVVSLGLTFSAGADGEGGMRIWPLFGTTNQLLASLTLSIIAVMLLRKRRNPWPALLPLAFVFVMSFYAAIVQLDTLLEDEDWLLLGIDAVIIVAAVWVAVEALLAMRSAVREPAEPDEADRLVSREAEEATQR